MKTASGDIWNYHADGYWVVVTTNIGWRKNGANPMGRGIARQAKMKFPDLPQWYGQRCAKYQAETAVALYPNGRLILFPTKPLNEDYPNYSWINPSTYELIEKSTKQLAFIAKHQSLEHIVLPPVGCGNGGLTLSEVLPILEKHLDDRFLLICDQFHLPDSVQLSDV